MSSSFLYPRDRYLPSDRRGALQHNSGPLDSRLGLTDESESREVGSCYTKPYLNSLADTATKRTRTSYMAEVEPTTPPTAERKTKAPASRRERCRINQARYRQRQRKYAEGLDTTINTLREEVQALEMQRQNVLRCAPTNDSVWVVATEYFRLFRHGFMAPMMVPETSSSSTGSSSSNKKRSASASLKQSNAQLDFLTATMVSDVTDCTVTGPDALLEHWRLFSLSFDDVHLQLKRMEQLDEESLLAFTTTSVTITESTLHHVFPHLGTERLSSIAAKLLNQRLVLRGSSRFDWDDTCGRVMRLESKVDLLSPMLQLLGNLEDVATAFENARVTPDGKFVVVEEN
ncbi:hypothetical protein PF005_g25178 [Phytophthora fragariae]|uniref:BZIP domain-containing protein n=2 Tax=Phytophthora fragariae TaxID=53985 RepID=A0A6A4BV15_9STRA|nr:hypothetical protein PF009_g25934 [Phytophthora fragariae]KAE8976809.1 hypothetical protein PF011_g23899 [Phytophthora fragariae]KAE9074925.1 hypothetical protein PF007_g25208 [Phytophthora fragariae]KAE9175944.1 hypothetical protein PF005_g25178 [Phytophthora fragariae]KAE9184031.1 hypothetical protein PF004_g23774 [Phytophthora fragariae]